MRVTGPRDPGGPLHHPAHGLSEGAQRPPIPRTHRCAALPYTCIRRHTRRIDHFFRTLLGFATNRGAEVPPLTRRDYGVTGRERMY